MTSWMSALPDNAYLSDLSIPGTHDTATGHDFTSNAIYQSSSQAQTLTVEQQANVGIRAMDFRPRVDGSTLRCAHGLANIQLTMVDAFHTLTTFLTSHPTEFFVIHLLYAHNIDSEQSNYDTQLTNLLADAAIAPRLIVWRPDLKVSDLRGKILLISRNDMNTCSGYVGGVFSGWPGDNLNFWNQSRATVENKYRGYDNASKSYCLAQDQSYTDGATGDVTNQMKVDAVTNLLSITMNRVAPVANTEQLITFNFCSGYDKSDKGLFAESSAKGYAHNAERTNKAVVDYLATHTGPTGIILMDYAGADTHKIAGASNGTYTTYGKQAVDAIVENNFKYLPRNLAGYTDITSQVSHPAMDNGSAGWTDATGFSDNSNGAVGQWNKTFNSYQTLHNMPAGTYRLVARGFYRCGYPDPAYQAHHNNTETLNAKLYLGTSEVSLPSLYNEATFPVDNGSGWNGVYADNITDANLVLNSSMFYQTEPVEFTLTTAGDLTFGVKKTTTVNGDWTAFTGFRLYYLGADPTVELARNAYNAKKALVTALRDATGVYTDHSGAVTTLNNALTASDNVVNAATDQAAIDAKTADLTQLAYNFVSSVKVNKDQYFDLTQLAITNADLDSNRDGWIYTPVSSGWGLNVNCAQQCVELYGPSGFDFHQVLANMPAGNYGLTMKAFSRPGSNGEVYNAWAAGTLNVLSEIYANNGTQKVKSVMEDWSDTELYNGQGGSDNNGDYHRPDGKYAPNGMTGARRYFDQGKYVNKVLTSLEQAGNLTIGFRSPIPGCDNWTIFDEFRLYYYGTTMAQELSENEKFFAAADIHHVDVTLHKTLYQGWNTVVLPFDAPVSFLGNGQLYSYTGESDGVLNFTSATTIAANTPYIYKATADNNAPLTIDDVTLVQTPAEVKAAGTLFHLIGSFDPATKVQAGDYVMGESAFLKANGGNAVIAYRAYIKNESPEETPAQVRIRINGEETTAIEAAEIISALTAQPVYNLQGQRLSQPRKGINVIGGKKIIKK